jgi:UDP-N-acetylglucosamine acyltransferase
VSDGAAGGPQSGAAGDTGAGRDCCRVSIHPTALVETGAIIPESAKIGPYCTVGADVVLGDGCELVSHVVLDGHTRLGVGCRVYSFAAVGVAPQDLKYAGEPTGLEIGDRTVIRECVTISRGTAGGGGTTCVGSDCLIMAYAHIGHDSNIGDNCILANGATLAGHVTVEEYATVGALCPVHQYCRIGRHAYVGGGTTITQDVLPYSLTSAKRETRAYGLNKVGLERRGFTREQLRALQHAYRLLLSSKRNTSQALDALRTEANAYEEVQYLLRFVETSERGVLK